MFIVVNSDSQSVLLPSTIVATQLDRRCGVSDELEVVRTRELERATADFAYSNYNGIKVARCVVIIRLNSVQQDFVAVVTSDRLVQLVLVYSPQEENFISISQATYSNEIHCKLTIVELQTRNFFLITFFNFFQEFLTKMLSHKFCFLRLLSMSLWRTKMTSF